MENRSIYDSDHELFRANARRFFREELEPNIEEWENASIVPREFWRSAGEKGLLCCGIPEEYGGPGADFKYNMISSEEIGYAIGGGSCGFALQSDITAYYILNHASEELKQKWLPKMVSGDVISSITRLSRVPAVTYRRFVPPRFAMATSMSLMVKRLLSPTVSILIS